MGRDYSGGYRRDCVEYGLARPRLRPARGKGYLGRAGSGAGWARRPRSLRILEKQNHRVNTLAQLQPILPFKASSAHDARFCHGRANFSSLPGVAHPRRPERPKAGSADRRAMPEAAVVHPA